MRAFRVSTPQCSFVVAATIFALIAPAAALASSAQGKDTGALVVVASDPGSQPLPGVAVTLVGPQGARTSYTASDGSVRFPGLIPGTYDASLALSGFKTLVREQLRISATAVITVRVGMELSAVEETIIVVGESPLIDVTQVQVGATVSEQLLNLTPTASGLWSGVLDRIPGVVNAKIDVGGADSGNQSTITSHGSLRGQNQFNLNGTAATNLGGETGSSGMYYSVGSFEEVAISTAAHDVEAQAPGVVINMISKSGGNQLRGMARLVYSTDSFVGDNIDSDLEEAGVTQGNPLSLLSDVNLQIGGPIVRDKLFAFADFWDFRTERLIEGVPADEPDDTRLRNWTVNTAWRISDDHRFSVRYFSSSKFRGNRFASAVRPPESAQVQDGRVQALQGHWQGVLSPTMYADVRVSRRWGRFSLQGRRPGTPNPHPDYPLGMPYTYELATNGRSGTPWEGTFPEEISQVAGNVARYIPGDTVSHDLKFGGGAWDAANWSADSTPGGIFQYKDLGEAVWVELDNSPQRDVVNDADPETSTSYRNRAWSLYLQDTITYKNRLTLGIGLRYDQSRSWNPRQRRLDSAFAGMIPDDQFGALYNAQEFPEQNPVVVFKDLVPRLSLLYDLSGAGRTVIKASYGRYSLQQGSTVSRNTNLNLTGTNWYDWYDANGDGIFQFGEQGTLLGSFFPGVTFAIDPDFRSPIQEEFTAGIEHELNRELSVGGTFIYHNTLHQMEDINTGVPYGSVAERLGVPDSYTPVEWLDPGPDGIPGTADDGGPITVYSQDPSTIGDDFYLLTNVDKWGLDAPVRYRGVELVVRRRYADGWQAMASWTLGKSTSGLGRQGGIGGIRSASVFNNPNVDINRFGLTFDDRRHIVKVTGNYLLRGIGVNFGANFRYESGPPALRSIRTPRGLLNQGRPLVSAAGRGEDTNEFGVGERFGDVVILDLRVEKQFRMPGRWGRISVYADGFNLTNENAVRSAVQTSGSAYGRVIAIVPARMLRIGTAWIF